MSIENRQYPRLESEFPVCYDIISSGSQQPLGCGCPSRKGIAKNIGGGGLYLVTSRTWAWQIKKMMQHVNNLVLEFCLPDFQNKIRTIGEVRWVKGGNRLINIFPHRWDLGIKFLDIQKEEKDMIIKYVINKQIEEHLTKFN